jgi:hypothetical protein
MEETATVTEAVTGTGTGTGIGTWTWTWTWIRNGYGHRHGREIDIFKRTNFNIRYRTALILGWFGIGRDLNLDIVTGLILE